MLARMRRHAGAVILLGGWLLMLPPTVEDPQDRAKKGFGWRAVTDAPIPKWDQLEAYDTAAQCEAVKAGETKFHTNVWGHFRDDRIRREAKHAKGKDPSAALHATVENALAREAVGYANARCVPAESVYPPQPTAPK